MRQNSSYRPTSGTEGAAFISRWCERCSLDAFDPDTGDGGCQILARTFVHKLEDPGYPHEWRNGEGGPICTAFDEAKA